MDATDMPYCLFIFILLGCFILFLASYIRIRPEPFGVDLMYD